MSFERVRRVETTKLKEHSNKFRLLLGSLLKRESKIKEARLECMEEVGKILSGNVSSGDSETQQENRYTIPFLLRTNGLNDINM